MSVDLPGPLGSLVLTQVVSQDPPRLVSSSVPRWHLACQVGCRATVPASSVPLAMKVLERMLSVSMC